MVTFAGLFTTLYQHDIYIISVITVNKMQLLSVLKTLNLQ